VISGHSVQFSSGQKKLYLPVCAQFSSVQVKKKGSHFLDPHRTPKNAQKTPQNAPKRPKRPKNAPKRPKNASFLTFVFSVQFRSVFLGQVSSGQFRSVQPEVKYLT
jgi:hypothetical protein